MRPLAPRSLTAAVPSRKGASTRRSPHLRQARALRTRSPTTSRRGGYLGRHVLAQVLLAAGRPAQAAAFRDDLRVLRETGCALQGLERAPAAGPFTKPQERLARRRQEA